MAALPLLAILALASCGPSGPAEGTPGFAWAKANENYAAGDYAKTLEQLDSVLSSDSEYTARALPWALVLNYGMASGNMQLADAYEEGAKANKAGEAALRRPMNLARNEANHQILRFAEQFAEFSKTKADTVPLGFPFPKGSAAEAPQILKIKQGSTSMTQMETDTAQKRSIERGVLLAAASVAGAGDDVAKGQQVFAAQDAKVPRATFQYAMAKALYDLSQIYAKGKLSDLEKMGLLCQRAEAALKDIPETEDSKYLMMKIQLGIKDSK